MKLILIHGAPAVGKLTVAQELAALTGIRVVDNHAAIDIARMGLDFDAPGFWELVHDLRLATLRGLTRAGLPWLITTSVYCHPDDKELVADYDSAVGGQGGSGLEPVFLTCDEATLSERVTSPARAQRRKISTSNGLRLYLAKHTVSALPHPRCLHLSTETASPTETAAAIALYFGLPVAWGAAPS